MGGTREGRAPGCEGRRQCGCAGAAFLSLDALERTFLANMGLYWAAYWVFAVLFTWVPSYLNKVVGYDTKTTGWMFMVFTIVSVPIVLGASWLSDRMLRNVPPR